MREQRIDNHIVVYDSYNLENKPELQKFLKSKKLIQILENIKQDVIMVLGGDGTILKAIRKHYKEQKAFLPINFGTKGFLLNDKEYIKKSSRFVEREYPLLDLKVKTENEILKDIAFNEVILKDIDGKMLDVNVSIGNENSLDFKGDGILVSTPAGSTGSNFSNYGPILPHSSNSFIVNYLGAYSPKRQPALIIESDRKIKIKNQNRKFGVIVSSDGNEIIKTSVNQDISLIVKKSSFKVRLLIEQSYENKWDNKVLEEQGFNM